MHLLIEFSLHNHASLKSLAVQLFALLKVFASVRLKSWPDQQHFSKKRRFEVQNRNVNMDLSNQAPCCICSPGSYSPGLQIFHAIKKIWVSSYLTPGCKLVLLPLVEKKNKEMDSFAQCSFFCPFKDAEDALAKEIAEKAALAADLSLAQKLSSERQGCLDDQRGQNDALVTLNKDFSEKLRVCQHYDYLFLSSR